MADIRIATRHRFVTLLAVALGLLLAGPQGAGAEANRPKITLDSTAYDFGKVPRGTVVRQSFNLRNDGGAPLQVQRMQFSMPGMRARVPASIAPGAAAELVVEWDTSHYTRGVAGEAVLKLNDPKRPEVTLRLTGFVVSPIDVDPLPAFYLSQFQGEASSQTLTIRNNQEREVHVTGIKREGESFTATFEPVQPGRTYAVTATGAADAPPGRHGEAAIVLTDDPDRPRIRLAVNLLVKRDVHASVEAIDMGRFRLAAVKANPSLLDLLRQTVILETRAPAMRVTAIEADLPFLTLSREPEGPSKRVRIDVGLALDKLTAGQHRGVVRIRTDVQAVPEMTLSVRLTVLE